MTTKEIAAGKSIVKGKSYFKKEASRSNTRLMQMLTNAAEAKTKENNQYKEKYNKLETEHILLKQEVDNLQAQLQESNRLLDQARTALACSDNK